MVFATEQENGVLLYDGQSEHLAVELFNGRIRVSYDVGNYPVSTMYRHVFSVLFKICLGVWIINFEICVVSKIFCSVDFIKCHVV